MSESSPPPRLPARPSLEQLRKQAKDLLRAARAGDPAASARILRVVPNAQGWMLADTQYVLAREYGFASWEKLVHHVESIIASDHLQLFDQLVRDYIDAWNGGSEGLKRLSDLHGRPLSPDEVRERVQRGFGGDELSLEDARRHVARLYGFASWEQLVESLAQPPSDPRTAPFGLSSSPPFYRIDWSEGKIEPRGPLSSKDWETLFAVMQEQRLGRLDASGQMTDAALAALTRCDCVTALNLGGCDRLSDDGLRHLARMPQLRHLDIGGWHSPITDRGLEVLRHLRELRTFAACWTRGISDAGIAHLMSCDQLTDVDLLGTPTGDGAIHAFTGTRLRKLKTGRLVTDAGLPLLQRIPTFMTPQPGAATYGIMEFLGGPISLLLDGPFTASGLVNLTPLAGLNGLSFFWHTTALSGGSLAPLAELPHLAMFGCQGALCDDAAMRHIAAMPNLRMLMAQGTVASDAGFAALSRSTTLEYIWGRECTGLGSKGFVALAAMPALKGIAVSCKDVDDDALSTLPHFQSLTALVPMDVPDAAFRHVGACTRLEKLWCMYCRDTGDRATELITRLANLKTYYAGATRITDHSLDILASLSSLEKVELWEVAGITDAGVTALAALPRLNEVTVAGSPNVTRNAFRALPARVRVNYW